MRRVESSRREDLGKRKETVESRRVDILNKDATFSTTTCKNDADASVGQGFGYSKKEQCEIEKRIKNQGQSLRLTDAASSFS